MTAEQKDLLSRRLGLALSQAKRVEREARIAKQMIAAAIRDLEPEEGHKDEQAEQDDSRLLEVQ